MEIFEAMPVIVAEGFAISCLVVSCVGAIVAVAKAIFNLIEKG